MAVVEHDAALAQWLLDPSTTEAGASPQRGDVLRTLGLDRPRPPADRYRYPIDVAVVALTDDGGQRCQAGFVAHLSIRDRPWTGLGPGLSVAVLNAPWLGPLRLGPKAHLNDGRLDVIEGVVGVRQRREATRRARSGDHLPHPALVTSRTSAWERSFDRPVTVWLDGFSHRRVRTVEVELRPDAGSVIA